MSTSNTEKFIDKANIKHLFKYDYSLVNYNTQREKVKIICKVHGEFEQEPKAHLQGKGCFLCGREDSKKTNTKNKENFILEAIKVHGYKFEYKDIDYVNRQTKIKIKCSIHGEFEQTPSNHLKGHGCTYCTYNNKSNEDFLHEAKKIHENKYDYSLVNYRNNKTKIKIICPEHGEFEQSPDHHINRKHGCPLCNESKGENEIRKFLTVNGINFHSQYSFSDCKNKNVLPFDFYLPDFNTCIEFNGIQHYKPIKYFGGMDKFKQQQINDKIKKDYCISNSIKLLIIRYNENINQKLNEKSN
jgi:hypothetical protein